MTRSLILLLFSVIFSEVSAFSLSDTLRYHIQHFTDEQGLPQNSINGIGVDEYGFIWLATEGGITRYDGRNFKIFEAEDLGIGTNRIPLIRYVHDSKKLFGMNGLYEKFLLSKGKAWHYNHTPGYMIKTPVDVIDNWIQNATGVPGYYDHGGSDLYQMDGVNGGNYIISHDTIFYYDRHHRIQSSVAFRNDDFYRFFLLAQRLFHIDFEGNVKSISPAGEIKDIGILGDILRDHTDLNQVKLYWNIGTTEVFFYMDGLFYRITVGRSNNLKSELLLKGFDFEQHDVFSAHYDLVNKRIFLGSKSKGLFVLTRKKFRALNAGEKLEEHLFYGQAPYDEDKILTTQGYIFSDTGLLDTRYNIREATNDRRSIIRDSKGFVWTTSAWKSLYKFSPDLDNVLLHREMPDAISCIQEGRNGEIWLGTFGNGVMAYDADRDTFRRFEFTKDEIICLMQTAADTLLAGTVYDGLLRLHIPSGKVDTIPGLARKSIRSLYRDPENNLWITTYNSGFFLYRNNVITHFPLDRNHYLKSAHCILEDKNGYFWISTNTGLFQVHKQSLLRYASDSTKIPSYIHFNRKEGFNTNEFNGGCQPCAITTGSGLFSIPSMNGLVVFHPDRIRPEIPDQEIIIDHFEVDGVPRLIDDSVTVEHGFRQIKIEIATAYFGNPYNLNLEYQIKRDENDNPKWFPVENEAIFLNDLKSGTHQIAIRQASMNSTEGFNRENIFIVVPPFYYESWSFIGLCIVALLLLLWAFYKWRSNRIRAQNMLLQQKVASQTHELQEYVSELERSESNLIKQTNLLENLSAAISHDIRSPLAFIIHVLHNISERLSSENHPLASNSELTYTHILQIYEYVNNLTNHTSSFLTHSKPKLEKINLYDLVQERIEFFTPLANEKGNQLINEINPKCELHTIGDLLIIVIHNLFDNANKYIERGTVIATAESQQDGLELRIIDNGKGMDPAQVRTINSGGSIEMLKSGLGLHIVQYLTTILDCHFRIISEPGQGTTAILFFANDQPI